MMELVACLLGGLLAKDCRCGHSPFDHHASLTAGLLLGQTWRPCTKRTGFLWRHRCECANYAFTDWTPEDRSLTIP